MPIDEFTYASVQFELQYSSAYQAAGPESITLRCHNTLFGQIRSGYVYASKPRQPKTGPTLNQNDRHQLLAPSLPGGPIHASPNDCTAFH